MSVYDCWDNNKSRKRLWGIRKRFFIVYLDWTMNKRVAKSETHAFIDSIVLQPVVLYVHISLTEWNEEHLLSISWRAGCRSTVLLRRSFKYYWNQNGERLLSCFLSKIPVIESSRHVPLLKIKYELNDKEQKKRRSFAWLKALNGRRQ